MSALGLTAMGGGGRALSAFDIPETILMLSCQTHRKPLRLVPDDGPRIATRSRERAMHGLVVIAHSATASQIPDEHQDWWYDLRRKRLNLCGGLFRFIDCLHRWGFPMDTALLIPQWIEGYVRERWLFNPPRTMAVRVLSHRWAA